MTAMKRDRTSSLLKSFVIFSALRVTAESKIRGWAEAEEYLHLSDHSEVLFPQCQSLYLGN